jgi:hypothetical protein
VSDSTHPLLPAAVPLLRGEGSVLRVGGVDTGDGVRVGPADSALAALLRSLDGRRSQRAVLADAVVAGLDPVVVAHVLEVLRDAALVVDLDPADLLASDGGPAAAARTATELPSATSPGAAGWRARRATAVVIEGATRVGAPLAAILAASGIGRVSVRDPGTVSAGDAVVGGLDAADEGRPRSLAAADAVRRASPLADLRPLPDGSPADLVVLTRPWAASDPLVRDVHRRGVPHLVATVRGDTGVVGPLVVPGVTGCLRCGDLHRRDADPTWPRVAAQLTGSEPPPSGATVTCLLTAATAAVQVLAFVDGAAAPAAVDATIELRPPDLTPRLRSWPAHPECGCRTTSDASLPVRPATLPGDPETAPPGGIGSRQGRMGG